MSVQRASTRMRADSRALPPGRPMAPLLDVLRTSGHALDARTRAEFEPRFGRDFSTVRMHWDASAAASARSLNARAYTSGSHIVFAHGRPDVHAGHGRRVLAHELTHVVQQADATAPPMGLDHGRADPLEAAAERHADAMSRPIPIAPGVAPPRLASLSHRNPAGSIVQRLAENDDPDRESMACRYFGIGCGSYTGGGGRSGGGGASGSYEQCPDVPKTPAPAPGVTPPSPPPPKPKAQGEIEKAAPKEPFFHGTRWSIAKTIPGNVKAVGGGDFSAGFYLHHDASASAAQDRALQWARRMSDYGKKEKYAGVIRFDVPSADFDAMVKANSKVFPLQGAGQKDYAARQKEWLDFITAHGREQDPTFRSGQWVHPRRAKQEHLPYDIVKGPFYTPLRGTSGKKPPASAFAPYAEGNVFPQQVVFANKGIDLLNDASKVKVELLQYDAKTGKRNDPPLLANDAAPGAAEIEKETEAAQMSLPVTA